MNKKYIIVSLDEAKSIIQYLPDSKIKSRFIEEQGADIQDIANILKSYQSCLACEVECQEHSCIFWSVNKDGRRLQRLIDRANYITYESENKLLI